MADQPARCLNLVLMMVVLAAAVVPGSRVLAASPYEVDLVTLVKDPQVTPMSVGDGVWNAAPAADRQLLLIPLRLKSVTEPTDVTYDGAKIVGGRFIAFFIPEGGKVGAGSGGGNFGGDEFREEEFGEFDQGGGNIGGGLAGLGGGLGGATGPQVDAAPPRMTRDLKLMPNGRISWKLTRGIPGAEVVKSQNKAYALYLDRSQIVRPVPPTAGARSTGGEDFDGGRSVPQRIDPAQRRAMQEQMRQAQAQYQQQMNAYTQLVRLVGQLPTEFNEPAPPVIYAIYDFPKLLPRISMTGDAPLPIELRVDQFTALRQIAAGQGDQRAIATVLVDVAGNGQPAYLSLAAAALSGNNQLHTFTPDNPLMRMIDPIMASATRGARMALVDAVGKNQQAVSSPFGAQILARAMRDPEPLVALTALKASMSQNQGQVDPAQLQQVAAAISNMLKSPDAPPMAETLGLLMQVSGSSGQGSTLPLQLLSSQVKLAAAPPARRQEMVDYIVAHARRKQPLAARWVDQQLLGSGDVALQVLTLETIAEGEERMLAAAGGAPGQSDPGFQRQGPGRNMPWRQMGFFNANDDAQYNSGVDEEGRMEEDFGDGGGQITGTILMPTGPAGPIPIERVDHAILPLLSSADQTVRPAAWAALPHFQFATNQNLPPDGFYQAVATAAVANKPTPAEAGKILNGNQPAQLAGLTKLVTDGDGPGRFTAARSLALNAPAQLMPALVAMSPDARQSLASWWYRLEDPSGGAARLKAPAFVGLIRQQGAGNAPSPVITWFIEQMQKRHTPPGASDWIAGVGGEAGVVAALASSDKAYGEAAAAALVGSVAWPSDEAVKMLQDQVAKSTLGVRDVALQQKKADEAWKMARPKIIAALMPQIAGNYLAEVRIATVATPNEMPKPPVATVAVANPDEFVEEPMEEYIEEDFGDGSGGFRLGPVPSGPPPTPMYAVECGQITLAVNGTNVQVSPIPLTLTISSEPVLAMKLAQPGQVMVLMSGKPTPPGFALPMQPIDFTADAYGNWVGTGWTPDARRIEVILTRVN